MSERIAGDAHFLTDGKAEKLLELIWIAVTEFGWCADMKVSEFAEDIAMSMDETTDRADTLRRLIEEFLT